MAESLIDWAQAESLLGGSQTRIEPEMAEIFLLLKSNTEQSLTELAAYSPVTHLPEIRALAHRLRGSLLNFGFIGVAQDLARLEREEVVETEYPSVVEKIIGLFQESIRQFEQRYPGLRS